MNFIFLSLNNKQVLLLKSLLKHHLELKKTNQNDRKVINNILLKL